MGNLHQIRLTAIAICLFLCVATACSPLAKVGPSADEVLFERGMSAARQKRFAVCHEDLETLVDTYPDSRYAPKARMALQNPQIANCGNSWGDFWTTSSECGIETMKPQQ